MAAALNRATVSARVMSSEIKLGKKAMRSSMKATLASLDDQAISAQSSRAQEALFALPVYQNAKRISVYLSMPHGEASSDAIVKHALSSGKAVFVPYIYPKADQSTKPSKAMDMLRLASLDEYTRLQRDSWGIPTLPAEAIDQRDNAIGGRGLALVRNSTVTPRDEARLDMVVVPGVAFDTDRNRLGHGAGYYDTFFSRYNAESRWRKPCLVGLCLAEQVLQEPEKVPVTDLDWRVDMIVTGDGKVVS